MDNASLYEAKIIETIDNGVGCWKHLKIGVWDKHDLCGLQVGSYIRNYPSMNNTFFAFPKNGKVYALYSPNYTCTRVMELPSCKDIGGENPNSYGFCPVDFFVPYDDNLAEFGFVAGCVWGDDSCWKIEYIDLSHVEQGVINRDARFGYIELPEGCNLRDIINCSKDDECVEIGCITRFDIKTGKKINNE